MQEIVNIFFNLLMTLEELGGMVVCLKEIKEKYQRAAGLAAVNKELTILYNLEITMFGLISLSALISLMGWCISTLADQTEKAEKNTSLCQLKNGQDC